jgi:hypothetical protein
MNDESGARSVQSRSDFGVSKVRFIFVALICASPAILLWDGLVTQGLVAGFVAVPLAITARSLRPGETEFLVSAMRPVAAVAAVPALWVLLQVLPVRVLAHPIWTSLETALGHPVTGAISIDPGASVIALGQYLSVAAIGLVSAAVAVDRQRAEWILFALTGAAAAIALILLADELIHSGASLRPFTRAQAIDCASMGAIIASAACIRTVERYETRQQHPQRSVPILLRTIVASIAALVICAAALVLNGTREVLVATGSGIAAFACMVIIRRFRQGVWYASMIAAATISVAVLVVAAQQAERGRSLLVAFAASPKGVSERVLEDAPLAGTGAGTFAAIAPIYREMDDPPPRSVASTAAAFAIELGRPMFWLISAATVGLIVLLLKASLKRGRDSFYPAMGGSCLITLMLLALVNAGLLATATGLIAAATLGLAFAQSKSRTIQR